MPPFPRFLPLPLAATVLSLACGGGAGTGRPMAGGSAALLPGALQLAFATPAGQVPAIHTSLVLRSGTPLEIPFMAYLTVPVAGDPGPVTLAVENRPPDLEVAVDGTTAERFDLALNAPHRLTLVHRGQPGTGTLAFRLRASIQGQDRLLPVVVTRGAAPFAILPPETATVTVAPGQTLAFPVHLWHADTYYAAQDGAYPAYQGVTFLGCSGDLPALTLEPAVATGLDLDLTVVPVVCQGVGPDLPGDGDLTGAMLAFWPLRAVNLAHRAPYVTATTWPPPGSPDNPAAWAQLLAELATLRILDGSSANYYGFVNPGFTAPPGWAITGLSSLGDGVSVGIDRAAARFFRNPDPDRNLATLVLVHEEGHAFNLAHVPAGGAAGPQLEYPYYGGSIGSWGYDPVARTRRDPAATSDIMGYGSRPHWVSDWNFRSAMGFLEQREPASARLTASGPEQWLVSGVVDPDGRVQVLPLVRAACRPSPPGPGDLELRLATAAGIDRASFAAAPAPDLPAGWRTFCFTVPAGGDATGIEVRAGGKVAFQLRSSRIRGLAAPASALVPQVREEAGVLHLQWDARVHPYAHVFHEGSVRTTLALHLSGGSADLPLDGLEPGGAFALHLTGGLEPQVIRVPR